MVSKSPVFFFFKIASTSFTDFTATSSRWVIIKPSRISVYRFILPLVIAPTFTPPTISNRFTTLLSMSSSSHPKAAASAFSSRFTAVVFPSRFLSVTGITNVFPLRFTVTSILSPGLLRPTYSIRAELDLIGVASNFITTSPSLMPAAFAALLSGSSPKLETKAPSFNPRSFSLARSLVTF